MKKLIRIISVCGALLFSLLYLAACNVSYQKWDYSGFPIEYQFQQLNRNTSSNASLNDLPVELRDIVNENLNERYEKSNSEYEQDYLDSLWDDANFYKPFCLDEYRFLISENVYVIYYISLYSDDYYVYKENNKELIIIISENSFGFLVKGNSLLYSTKNSCKETNVLTKETKDISVKEFEDEYVKYVPGLSKLKDGSSFRKDYPIKDKNTVENPACQDSRHSWRTMWFFYNGEYYFVEKNNSFLCKYDIESDSYTRLSKMGYRPTACFLDEGYIYYLYGQEGYNFFDALLHHNPQTQLKKVAYARVSLITSQNEKIKKADFLKLYDNYI